MKINSRMKINNRNEIEFMETELYDHYLTRIKFISLVNYVARNKKKKK